MDLFSILQCRQQKQSFFAPIIDPEKQAPTEAARRGKIAEEFGADFLLVGGTRIPPGSAKETVRAIRSACSLTIILLPGADDPEETIVEGADAFFCPLLHNKSNIDVERWYRKASIVSQKLDMPSVPLSYIMASEGRATSMQRDAGVVPFDFSDPDFISALASEGEMRGQMVTYLEPGSGADQPLPNHIITAVYAKTTRPLITSVDAPERAAARVSAGISIIVVGNRLETSFTPSLVSEFADAIHNTQIPAQQLDKYGTKTMTRRAVSNNSLT